jgi:hypothetical protein
MAGDWIKMKTDLANEPEVIGISTILAIEIDLVVGKLHRAWSWANKHTTNGNAPIVTRAWLDEYVRVTGFAEAMISVGWLRSTDNSISFPKFDVHNSKGSKRRALASFRQALHRSRKSVTKVTSREEKRREEKSIEIPPLPPNLETEPFKKTWDEWVLYRRQKNKKLTPLMMAKQFGQLSKYGPEKSVEMLNRAMMNGWTGFDFPNGSGAVKKVESMAERLARVRAEDAAKRMG